jgi:hypothetical protein
MSTMSQNESQAFEEGLVNFKKRLSKKELEDFEGTKLEDLKITINRIQEGQENVKQNMDMTRVGSFLEAMEQFGKILDVFLNASPFVAFVWGPMKFMLMVMHPFDLFHSLLLEGMDDDVRYFHFGGKIANNLPIDCSQLRGRF